MQDLLQIYEPRFPRLFVIDNHRGKQEEYPFTIDEEKTTSRAIHAWAQSFVTASEIAAKEAELAVETKSEKKFELQKTIKKLKQSLA